ncbi:MAG: hypothetical protein CM1200mP30_33880 [Pseudomonadota bacterium]|nr:MAG: hypothetical protein CM1200mP30_33880 [Pseudomonadota bacterium]
MIILFLSAFYPFFLLATSQIFRRLLFNNQSVTNPNIPFILLFDFSLIFLAWSEFFLLRFQLRLLINCLKIFLQMPASLFTNPTTIILIGTYEISSKCTQHCDGRRKLQLETSQQFCNEVFNPERLSCHSGQ